MGGGVLSAGRADAVRGLAVEAFDLLRGSFDGTGSLTSSTLGALRAFRRAEIMLLEAPLDECSAVPTLLVSPAIPAPAGWRVVVAPHGQSTCVSVRPLMAFDACGRPLVLGRDGRLVLAEASGPFTVEEVDAPVVGILAGEDSVRIVDDTGHVSCIDRWALRADSSVVAVEEGRYGPELATWDWDFFEERR